MKIDPSFLCHCVVGPGRLGSSLVAALIASDQRVLAVGARSGRLSRPQAPWLPPEEAVRRSVEAAAAADVRLVLWLTVPDDAIAAVGEESAGWAGESASRVIAVHCSGFGGLDLLTAWRGAGAETLSLHPLQSFAGAADGSARGEAFAGVPIAVTAAEEAALELGFALALAIGGQPFALDDADKPLYHLAAVVASNLLVALQAEAGELLRQAASLPSSDAAARMLGPLVGTTLANIGNRGPEGALTGPVARGDVGTVRAHLALLERQPERLRTAYRALSLQALALAAPRLDNETVRALHSLLDVSAVQTMRQRPRSDGR